jgi:hypothetical protein
MPLRQVEPDALKHLVDVEGGFGDVPVKVSDLVGEIDGQAAKRFCLRSRVDACREAPPLLTPVEN